MFHLFSLFVTIIYQGLCPLLPHPPDLICSSMLWFLSPSQFSSPSLFHYLCPSLLVWEVVWWEKQWCVHQNHLCGLLFKEACLPWPSRGSEPASPLPPHTVLIFPWSPIHPPHCWQMIFPKLNPESGTCLSEVPQNLRIKSRFLGKPLTLYFLLTISTSSLATPSQAACTQGLSKGGTCCSRNIPPFLLLLSSVVLPKPFLPGIHFVQKASPDSYRQWGTSSSVFPQHLVQIMILYLLWNDRKYFYLYNVSPTKLWANFVHYLSLSWRLTHNMYSTNVY